METGMKLMVLLSVCVIMATGCSEKKSSFVYGNKVIVPYGGWTQYCSQNKDPECKNVEK